MEKWAKVFFFWFLVFGLILVGRLEISADQKPALAILPFFLERGEDPARGAVCPVCKGVYQRGDIAPVLKIP